MVFPWLCFFQRSWIQPSLPPTSHSAHFEAPFHFQFSSSFFLKLAIRSPPLPGCLFAGTFRSLTISSPPSGLRAGILSSLILLVPYFPVSHYGSPPTIDFIDGPPFFYLHVGLPFPVFTVALCPDPWCSVTSPSPSLEFYAFSSFLLCPSSGKHCGILP